MNILGIETSCDETAVCLIQADGDQIKVLGNQLYSQVAKHAEFGGVFPTIAKREHQKNLVPLLEKCLVEAEQCDFGGFAAGQARESKISAEIYAHSKITLLGDTLSREPELLEQISKSDLIKNKPNIDSIAVTNGPGLEPALWVGVNFAKALSAIWNIPVIPTNHLEGHIVAALLSPNTESEALPSNPLPSQGGVPSSPRWVGEAGLRGGAVGTVEYKIKKTNYPAISLLISGGHTQLVLVKNEGDYEIIGNTKDDAIGEAFDKVARILGLPYPGGPEISKLARKEREEFPDKKTAYPLPRPMIKSGDLNFSFSGIKTAVLYTVKKINNLTDEIKQEIAREFEDAVIEVLLTKTKQAVKQTGAKTLIIGGGVSANKKIRQDLQNLTQELGLQIYLPEISTSTDNALMIAVAGYINILAGKKPVSDFRADGNLSLSLLK